MSLLFDLHKMIDKTQKVDMSFISCTKKSYSVKVARLGVRKDFYKNLMGTEEALSAALAFRDSLYMDFGISSLEKGPQLKVKSRKENGVISGVNLEIDGNYAYFICSSYAGDNRVKIRFSIRALGYSEAFYSAVKRRIEDGNLSIDPSSIPLQRPTIDQFLVLVRMAKDVPVPMKCNSHESNFVFLPVG